MNTDRISWRMLIFPMRSLLRQINSCSGCFLQAAWRFLGSLDSSESLCQKYRSQLLDASVKKKKGGGVDGLGEIFPLICFETWFILIIYTLMLEHKYITTTSSQERKYNLSKNTYSTVSKPEQYVSDKGLLSFRIFWCLFKAGFTSYVYSYLGVQLLCLQFYSCYHILT